jgi:hyperosmotically inducible periplasmic protein
MKTKHRQRHLAPVALLLAVAAGALAAAPPAPPPSDPENTGVNKRDAPANNPNAANPTPMDQSNKQPDLRTEAEVRKAIVNDKSLSMLAHNVKIMTADGVVTLRGPVKSAEEKQRIGDLAKHVQGVSSVKNELDTSNSSRE